MGGPPRSGRGKGMTRWTRPVGGVGLRFKTTAQSRANCHSITETNLVLWPSEKPRRTSDRRRGDDGQVEQDWVLSRAVVELFSRPELKGKLALRGGTALNKLLQPSHLAI